jgi:hypothetical protein
MKSRFTLAKHIEAEMVLIGESASAIREMRRSLAKGPEAYREWLDRRQRG